MLPKRGDVFIPQVLCYYLEAQEPWRVADIARKASRLTAGGDTMALSSTSAVKKQRPSAERTAEL